MNGPSARALREGGIGGSIPYKVGVTLYVKPKDSGPIPKDWLKKTTFQAPFGDFGQILRIDVSETQRCAYVEYEDPRDAQDAAKDLDGKKISGKEVSVVLASQATNRRPGSTSTPVGPPGRAVDIEQRVAELALKHHLDEAAGARLASVFQDRSRLGCDLVRDFQDLDEHLTASNKPSALVSMKLSELRSGRPIGRVLLSDDFVRYEEPPSSPAAGSGAAAVRQKHAEEAGPKAEASSMAEVKAEAEKLEPEAARTLGSTERVDLAQIPDPWAEVSDAKALEIIKEDTLEVIEVQGEASAAAHLAAKDAELQSFQPSSSQREFLVSADLSENQLATVASLQPLWLRYLSLAMNPLESFEGLCSFPRLLVLDVSFIELTSIEGAWQAIADLPRLARLVAEGCSICSLEVELPAKLQALEVSDNAIEELSELDALASRCKSLLELDLRENEVVLQPGYAKKINKLFPSLTWLDNQSRKKYVAKGAAATYAPDALREKDVAAVDGMFKNESCSCLEGNACLDAATCKDWPNREKVAAAARKRKGLRDDSGSGWVSHF
ncbi:unnamed protein product [Effrenium voratum]|uniref:RRM domain-containing protein n=1 Tax=Effrenium voratum TaxID=2562239 RepID=A0AA36J3B1_9DINO|nr:unnamed protein product [Effrenium voratum]